MTTLDKFRRKAAADPLLRSVRRKAEAGTADFHDTARYSERAAEILGETLSADILSTPHGERAGACEALLHEQYADTCELLCDVQEALDAETGLYIAPQVPEYPEERVEQVAQSLEDETVPDETIERRARSAPENVAKAFHDAYMRENAKFRSAAGVKCQIVREGNGCCPWCAQVAGKYEYGDEPDDVYRRHDNCTCTVIFENGKQRQDVWSKRTWEAPASDAGADEPTRFDGDSRPTGFVPHILTGGEKSGTINYAKAISSMFYADDYEHKTYTIEEIFKNLGTSLVGKEAIQYLESNPQVKVMLSENPEVSNRGEHFRNLLTVWLNNCPNVRVAAQTIIHEVTHHKYDIGGSQQAEMICCAFEKMHKENRNYLTQEEWNNIVALVQEFYYALPDVGGEDILERFDFIVKKE